MSQQFCRKCGAVIRDGFRFCEKCGTPVQQIQPVQQGQPVPPPSQNDGRTIILQGDMCPFCRTINKKNAQFCEKCGRQLNGNMPTPPPGSLPPTPPIPSKQNKGGKKGKSTVLIVILVLLLVAVLGIGGFLIYSFMNENKADTTDTGAVTNETSTGVTAGSSGQNAADNPYADPELEPSKIPAGDDATKHTYELVKADITWSEAERLAEEKGGYLACISDANEEKEIVDYLAQYNDLKIVYIGAKRGTVGFKWVSGEQFTYYNWAAGEPNNYNNVESFVCLYNADGSGWKWNDCSDNMYQQGNGQFTGFTGYLIEYNSVSNTTSTTAN